VHEQQRGPHSWVAFGVVYISELEIWLWWWCWC